MHDETIKTEPVDSFVELSDRKSWVKPEMTVASVADAELGLGVGADLIILGTSS